MYLQSKTGEDGTSIWEAAFLTHIITYGFISEICYAYRYYHGTVHTCIHVDLQYRYDRLMIGNEQIRKWNRSDVNSQSVVWGGGSRRSLPTHFLLLLPLRALYLGIHSLRHGLARRRRQCRPAHIWYASSSMFICLLRFYLPS